MNDIAPTPANEGVISNEVVAPAGTARCIRRITWPDPDSGQAWQHLTHEMKLPASLIVLLYRRRGDLLNDSRVSYTAGASWKPRFFSCPNANDLVNTGASAPTGRRIPAQGNALSKPRPPIPAF